MSTAPLRVIIGGFGTLGEIYPCIAVGRALAQAGHDVRVVAPGNYEHVVCSAGLTFSQLCSASEYDRMLAEEHLWHPLLCYWHLAQLISRFIERAYREVATHMVPGRTVLVLSWMFPGGRIAQEVFGIPAVTLHANPTIFRSSVSPARIPFIPFSARAPLWWNDLWFRVIDGVMDLLLARPVNAFRARFGLPPVRRIVASWINSPDCVIGLFPPWFAQPQSDWPPQGVLCDFSLYDGADSTELASDVLAFLDQGAPPVVISASTHMPQLSRYYSAAIEGCARAGRRSLVITSRRDSIASDLPEGAMVTGYVRHSRLLPRCAAIVHNGGIGTTAQALRAGIPQLIVPMVFDQSDNAARVERLGAGLSIAPGRFNAERAASALVKLMGPDCARACELAKRRFETDGLLENVVPLVEQAFARHGPAAGLDPAAR